MMYPHTISVFNQFTNDDGEQHFYKTVVKDVLFIRDDSTARNKLGLTNADTITCYVSMNSNRESEYVDSSVYRVSCENGESGFFTFAKGDYIAFGDVGETDMNINKFKNETENIFEVTGIIDYRFGSLKSLVVSAK